MIEDLGILSTALCQSVPTHFICEVGVVEFCSAMFDTVLQDLGARDPQMAEPGRNCIFSVWSQAGVVLRSIFYQIHGIKLQLTEVLYNQALFYTCN